MQYRLKILIHHLRQHALNEVAHPPGRMLATVVIQFVPSGRPMMVARSRRLAPAYLVAIAMSSQRPCMEQQWANKSTRRCRMQLIHPQKTTQA